MVIVAVADGFRPQPCSGRRGCNRATHAAFGRMFDIMNALAPHGRRGLSRRAIPWTQDTIAGRTSLARRRRSDYTSRERRTRNPLRFRRERLRSAARDIRACSPVFPVSGTCRLRSPRSSGSAFSARLHDLRWRPVRNGKRDRDWHSRRRRRRLGHRRRRRFCNRGRGSRSGSRRSWCGRRRGRRRRNVDSPRRKQGQRIDIRLVVAGPDAQVHVRHLVLGNTGWAGFCQR